MNVSLTCQSSSLTCQSLTCQAQTNTDIDQPEGRTTLWPGLCAIQTVFAGEKVAIRLDLPGTHRYNDIKPLGQWPGLLYQKEHRGYEWRNYKCTWW